MAIGSQSPTTGRACRPSWSSASATVPSAPARREAYAAPDRGAQGNALQVLMALPFGFGRDQAVTTITSRGVEHLIMLRVNRLERRIDVERIDRPVAGDVGDDRAPDLAGAQIDLAEIVDADRRARRR